MPPNYPVHSWLDAGRSQWADWFGDDPSAEETWQKIANACGARLFDELTEARTTIGALRVELAESLARKGAGGET